MSRRRGRTGQVGAEALELVAILPLLGLVFFVLWQGVVLMRQQAEAQSDARELARRAVLCARAAPVPTLDQVDRGAAGTVVTRGGGGGSGPDGQQVRVEVRLAPRVVLPGFRLDQGSALAPHAVVVMRREPC